jgi:citronellyl-CoA synthetase
MGAIGNFFGDLKVVLRSALQKTPADDQIGSLGLLVQQHADNHPEDIALLCEDEAVSWRGLNERANRVAHCLQAQGIQHGDCVSIFMQNRIEFVVCLVGLAKLGAVGGLINTNLTLKPLTHCVNLVKSKKCIFGAELTEPLGAIRADLSLTDGVDYLFVPDTGSAALANPVSAPDWAVTLDVNDPNLPSTNPADTATITLGSKAFYIFTSGTTGLPKAAIVSHKRSLFAAATAAHSVLRLQHSDRMYNCLPLYHGTGLMMGLMATFQVGASTVIKRRLSVSAFWEDTRKYHCTSFVYIGEFIRYLMSKPELANDNQNPVRTIIGNGLRPDIWETFQARFNIERIGEFYGASEGNSGFANVFNKTCTVGLSSAPAKLVAYDVALDEILRDANGFCREVNPGETGLLLIEVTTASKFEGYTDTEASAKKLTKDVIKEGDLYFNSGDLMKTVDVGFAFGQTHYQFVDRVGDTFRWKSENVSTNEIAEIINAHPDVIFSNVYGVEIPGADGRAGMAALVFRDDLSLANVDLASLSKHITTNLPSYARPLFIRVLQELPTTTTHKLQKNELRAQAYHLDKVEDDLLVLKPGEPCYSRLDTDFYDKVIGREIAF